MGPVVIASAMFIPGVLLSDVLYAWLDPRIRLRQKSSSRVLLRTA